MRQVLQRLREKLFVAKLSKCEFAVNTVKYLGHLVSHGKVAIDPGKSDTVMSWLMPMCVKEVQ